MTLAQFERSTLGNGLRVLVRAGPLQPARRGRGRLRRRLPIRAGGADRLRSPLRTPDVPRLRQRREDRALPADSGRRRGPQRAHPPGPHGLLRGAPFGRARAHALARGRPHGCAGAHGREPSQPGLGRRGGDQGQRSQPALRRLSVDPVAGARLRHLPERPQRLRRLRPSRGGDARRRRRLLREVLRPRERGPGRRRRLRRRRRRRASRPVLRSHRAAARLLLSGRSPSRTSPRTGGSSSRTRSFPSPPSRPATGCPTRSRGPRNTSRTSCWRTSSRMGMRAACAHASYITTAPSRISPA